MSPGPPDRQAELYDKLLATCPEIERKGASNRYTSVNGNMFTLLSPAGTVAIRLGTDDREAFIEKYRSRLYEAHGTVMKEYVEVPADLLERTSELNGYLLLSYAYAKTLKPKATTRKRRR